MHLWYVPAALAIIFALGWLAMLFAPLYAPGVPLEHNPGDLGGATAVSVIATWFVYPR